LGPDKELNPLSTVQTKKFSFSVFTSLKDGQRKRETEREREKEEKEKIDKNFVRTSVRCFTSSAKIESITAR
jgi:hypothetical protein